MMHSYWLGAAAAVLFLRQQTDLICTEVGESSSASSIATSVANHDMDTAGHAHDVTSSLQKQLCTTAAG